VDNKVTKLTVMFMVSTVGCLLVVVGVLFRLIIMAVPVPVELLVGAGVDRDHSQTKTIPQVAMVAMVVSLSSGWLTLFD
jgi:hypothetical protein